jgi:hypothetical protein
MAQIKYTADIHTAEFPLLLDWAARTAAPSSTDEDIASPVKTPQILYAQNVLPTQQGVKSVSFKALIAAAIPANLNFATIYTVADSSQNKALLGVTSDSHIYIITPGSLTWLDVTPSGYASSDAGFTVATSNGNWYCYLQNKGLYLVVISGTPTLTLQTLVGVTGTAFLGVVSAVNYLILWDATHIYWNSATNNLDFTPSLVTGAGSTTPTDLEGTIVTIVQLNNGFCIYTSTNAVLGSFSNNTQYPWILRNANNVGGIASYRNVNVANGLGFHIVLTFAGIVQVTPTGGTIIVPEVADFLAARTYESWDPVGLAVVKQVLSGVLLARVAVLGARYICISYGISSYTDVLVYDIALKRFGRLTLAHTSVFEVEVNLETPIHSYISLLGNTYASRLGNSYIASSGNLNAPPVIGRIFGLLQLDGTVQLAFLDYNSSTDNAILLLGKFELTRSYLLDLEEVSVESLPVSDTNFTLLDLSSINGKDTLAAVTPVLTDSGNNIRTYKTRVSAKNHILAFGGSFNLTSVEIVGVMDARR